MLLNHCVMTVFSLKKRMNEWINSSLRDGFVVFCWYRFVILSLRLMAIFPGESGLASLIGDNWSCQTCTAPVKSSPITNQHPVFLQAGCPSCRPTNSIRALNEMICNYEHWWSWLAAVCSHVHADTAGARQWSRQPRGVLGSWSSALQFRRRHAAAHVAVGAGAGAQRSETDPWRVRLQTYLLLPLY